MDEPVTSETLAAGRAPALPLTASARLGPIIEEDVRPSAASALRDPPRVASSEDRPVMHPARATAAPTMAPRRRAEQDMEEIPQPV